MLCSALKPSVCASTACMLLPLTCFHQVVLMVLLRFIQWLCFLLWSWCSQSKCRTMFSYLTIHLTANNSFIFSSVRHRNVQGTVVHFFKLIDFIPIDNCFSRTLRLDWWIQSSLLIAVFLFICFIFKKQKVVVRICRFSTLIFTTSLERFLTTVVVGWLITKLKWNCSSSMFDPSSFFCCKKVLRGTSKWLDIEELNWIIRQFTTA